MHYLLRCLSPQNENGEACMEVHNAFRVGTIRNWKDGRPLPPDARDIPLPIRVEFEPFRGYAGPPVELRDRGIPLMSRRLSDAVTESGVDNIEFLPVVLRNTATGQEYDYRAFKIIGLVAAADLTRSDWTAYDHKPVADVSFSTLALAPEKLRGQLLFRLAENLSAIVVHEKVRRTILSAGIDTIEFVQPGDWAHL